tara:strand:+ start:3960 stop:4181 length:222 start_codon:yes stop_codon:yes gene_type:complete
MFILLDVFELSKIVLLGFLWVFKTGTNREEFTVNRLGDIDLRQLRYYQWLFILCLLKSAYVDLFYGLCLNGSR